MKKEARSKHIQHRRRHITGSIAFVIAFIFAVIVGMIGSINTTMSIVLMTVGFLVGIINVTHKETLNFLASGVSLVLVSALGQNIIGTVPQVSTILYAINIIFVPATILVAVKNVFSIATYHTV